MEIGIEFRIETWYNEFVQKITMLSKLTFLLHIPLTLTGRGCVFFV